MRGNYFIIMILLIHNFMKNVVVNTTKKVVIMKLKENIYTNI